MIKCGIYSRPGYNYTEFHINNTHVERFLVATTELAKSDILSISEARGIFLVKCDGFRIGLEPIVLAYWVDSPLHHAYEVGINGLILAAKALVKKSRTIYARINHRKYTITVTESYVKTEAGRRYAKVYVKNQDGKWVMQNFRPTYTTNEGPEKVLRQCLKFGFSQPAPLTKIQMLKEGIPAAHAFNTDDRLTCVNDGWHQIRESTLWKIKIEGIVTINPDRTVKDAINPSGEDAWFQILCCADVGGLKFTVLSNGTHYHIMTRVGQKMKVVADTKINSMIDGADITRLDQTMIREAMADYVENLIK